VDSSGQSLAILETKASNNSNNKNNQRIFQIKKKNHRN